MSRFSKEDSKTTGKKLCDSNTVCRCKRIVSSRAIAANGQRRSRRGFCGSADRRVSLVHPSGFSAALARERAQVAFARAALAIHRAAVAAKSGVTRHDASGRSESELVAEPR